MRDPTNESTIKASRDFVHGMRSYYLNLYPFNPDTINALAKEAIPLHHRLTLAINHIENLQAQIDLLRSEIASPTE